MKTIDPVILEHDYCCAEFLKDTCLKDGDREFNLIACVGEMANVFDADADFIETKEWFRIRIKY